MLEFTAVYVFAAIWLGIKSMEGTNGGWRVSENSPVTDPAGKDDCSRC